MVMEMSKTYQYRKVMKPLLERKRRARINKCLDDLKDLVVECLQQDGEHVTRLEKADILELTVELMRKLKQRGRLSLSTQPNLQIESFRSGYVHAADQITQVLLQQRQTDEVGQKVVKFLSSRLVELQHQLVGATSSSSSSTPPSLSSLSALPTVPISIPTSPGNFGMLTSAHNNLLHNIPLPSGSDTYSFMDSDCSSEAGESDRERSCMQPNNSDNQLIDVTTVEEKSSLSDAGESSDSNSEAVWRPW